LNIIDRACKDVRFRRERERRTAWKKVQVMRHHFGRGYDCSLCARPMRTGVLASRSDLPYWWAFCLDCAEQVGMAAE
jgi:hypothetical protein